MGGSLAAKIFWADRCRVCTQPGFTPGFPLAAEISLRRSRVASSSRR